MPPSDAPVVSVYAPDPVVRTVLIDLARQYGLTLSFSDIPETGLSLSVPLRAGEAVRMLLRTAQEQTVPVGALEFSGYEFDVRQSTLRVPDSDIEILLTEKEASILRVLLAAGGDFVSRRDLLTSVWGYVEGVETHTLETHIYRLRQKIEKDPSAPEILLTAEQGYRIITV